MTVPGFHFDVTVADRGTVTLAPPTLSDTEWTQLAATLDELDPLEHESYEPRVARTATALREVALEMAQTVRDAAAESLRDSVLDQANADSVLKPYLFLTIVTEAIDEHLDVAKMWSPGTARGLRSRQEYHAPTMEDTHGYVRVYLEPRPSGQPDPYTGEQDRKESVGPGQITLLKGDDGRWNFQASGLRQTESTVSHLEYLGRTLAKCADSRFQLSDLAPMTSDNVEQYMTELQGIADDLKMPDEYRLVWRVGTAARWEEAGIATVPAVHVLITENRMNGRQELTQASAHGKSPSQRENQLTP